MTSLARRDFSAAERTEMWARWRQGETVSQIAPTLERSHTSVSYAVRHRGGFSPTLRRRAARRADTIIRSPEEIMKTAIAALGKVAEAGIDPAHVTKEVFSAVVNSVQNTRLASGTNPALPASPPAPPAVEVNQLEREKLAMASVKTQLGIVTYTILEMQSNIKGAIIQMPGYEIIINCSDAYPQEAPQVTIRMADGSVQTVEGYWISGISNNLAQALFAIIPQIRPTAE